VKNLRTLGAELQRPQVLLGLGLFVAASLVLYHAWKGRDTPWPLGAFMPF
jgi:hypothetical protein